LSPDGCFGVADFYVAGQHSFADHVDRDYGVQSRHVNWLSRQFWRIWYSARVLDLFQVWIRPSFSWPFKTRLSRIPLWHSQISQWPKWFHRPIHHQNSILRLVGMQKGSRPTRPQEIRCYRHGITLSQTIARPWRHRGNPLQSIRPSDHQPRSKSPSPKFSVPTAFMENSIWSEIEETFPIHKLYLRVYLGISLTMELTGRRTRARTKKFWILLKTMSCSSSRLPATTLSHMQFPLNPREFIASTWILAKIIFSSWNLRLLYRFRTRIYGNSLVSENMRILSDCCMNRWVRI
jgi:hypothetical protein